MSIDIELYQILCTKKTQVQMMKDRGYVIPQSEQMFLESTAEDLVELFPNIKNDISPFNQIYKHKTFAYVGKKPEQKRKKQMVVYYIRTDKKTIGVNPILIFLNFLYENVFDEYILIVNKEIYHKAKREVEKFLSENFPEKKIISQIFFENELTYNLIDIAGSSTYKKLETNVGLFLSQTKIGSGGLNLMSFDDPIARYYGWLPGDIIQILYDDTELNTIYNESKNFRLIIN